MQMRREDQFHKRKAAESPDQSQVKLNSQKKWIFPAIFLIIACLIAAGSYTYYLSIRAATAKVPIGAVVVKAQGFDSCNTPSASAMAAWWGHAPYRWIAAYMGGDAYASSCSNANFTATWVNTIIGQGWSLAPIWVGLQAPCSGIAPAMSSTTATSKAQGISDADQAVAAAVALGLPTGVPIFFDMEHYDAGNASCIAAVNSFIDGWDQEVTAKGFMSAVYLSASDINSMRTGGITVPKDIWMAGGGTIYTSSYNANCSVFGNNYVSDSYWVTHQRAYQYTGGHTETYNGVSINIDSDCSDLYLASKVKVSTPTPTPVVSTSTTAPTSDVSPTPTALSSGNPFPTSNPPTPTPAPTILDGIIAGQNGDGLLPIVEYIVVAISMVACLYLFLRISLGGRNYSQRGRVASSYRYSRYH
jgi:Domain of unknown function (DUF1906)